MREGGGGEGFTKSLRFWHRTNLVKHRRDHRRWGTMGAAECVECGRKCTEDERSESEGTFERSENPKGEPGVCERLLAKRGAGDGGARGLGIELKIGASNLG